MKITYNAYHAVKDIKIKCNEELSKQTNKQTNKHYNVFTTIYNQIITKLFHYNVIVN